MTIKVDSRFLPFSHQSPTICLIPKSTLAAEICPARLKIFDPATNALVYETSFSFGPLKKFTVTLDLERASVDVSGFAKSGFIRYQIHSDCVRFLKGSDAVHTFPEGGRITCTLDARERLSLGSHKAQDAEHILRRLDLKEILPIWFFLSQSIPKIDSISNVQSPSLFAEAQCALAGDHEALYEKLLNLFQAGFKSLFFPRLIDDSFLGFEHPVLGVKNASPLLLLQESYPLIRSLFFQEKENTWNFLPALPPQFHCGRMIDLTTKKGHKLSIEWTKKFVRQIILEVRSDEVYAFKYAPCIKRFRVSSLEKGPLGVFPNGAEIPLFGGGKYLLDRFEG